MKKSVLILICSLALVTACSMTKKHEENLAKEAEPLGLKEAGSDELDSVFIADAAGIASYKQVILTPLDMSSVKIRKPSDISFTNNTPWELNDQDRNYYQERYADAMKKEWLDKDGLKQVDQAAEKTLLVKAVLKEIAPLGSKDDFKGRPVITKVYSEGVGTMTIQFEISDAKTGKVLALISDQRDLGKMWEENNRATFNQQVRIAFTAWASRLQKQFM
jgi:hypothetical protein